MTTVKLKVLTLNCWFVLGVFVPLACKDRLERMKEIGRELSVGNYDIVFLQEVWLKSDYQLLCQYILPAMPYTHYYYSGIIGSGLCLFSKFKIIETSQFRSLFSLNGYAHRLMCGDWMADKSVGFAKILLEPGSIKLNAYTTHLHAQYSEDNTYHAYEEHRCLQSFELAKFLRDTSCSCDCVVVGGDFNITPN
ncbi:hypothetical protein HELRODRAFT_143940, partial [Helobdella robusta]|uniref:sphingomyelin phosphodiesterase n=1 Tax=Helobdella robusta TaxID=6412 RepID=T1EJD1_HELRO